MNRQQPIDSKKVFLLLAVAALLCLVLIAVILFAWILPQPQKEETVSSVVSSSVIQPPQESVVSEVPENVPKEHVFPEELLSALQQSGTNPEELARLGCRQLVVVFPEGTSAEIRFYECSEDNSWTVDDALTCSGFVGKQGTVVHMSEDISGTPKGFYPVGSAFYIGEPPLTKLEVFEVTKDTYWVDDPDSDFYNQRVEGTENRDWKSAEHMIDYRTSYRYGFVVNYNMPAVYRKGSAIFFHVGSVPTQGCIATSEKMVLQYLSRLDQAENPYILIL